MLMSTPLAPFIETSSSSGLEIALSAATRRAVRTLGLAGAHHRLAHLAHHGADVGEVEIDQAGHDHQVGDAAHAQVQHVVGHLEGVGEGRLLVGDPEQVLVRDDDQRVDHLLELVDALLGRRMRRRPSKWNGLVTTPMVRMPCSRAACGDHRRRAGAGAAAHAGGDEHHVGAVEQLQDLGQRFFGGLAADLGARAGAEALGDRDAELDAAVGERLAERLGVGVGDDEFHAFQRGADHVVDGISAGAADADDGDARLNLRLLLRETEVDGHSALSTQTRGVSARSGSAGPSLP